MGHAGTSLLLRELPDSVFRPVWFWLAVRRGWIAAWWTEGFMTALFRGRGGVCCWWVQERWLVAVSRVIWWRIGHSCRFSRAGTPEVRLKRPVRLGRTVHRSATDGACTHHRCYRFPDTMCEIGRAHV